MTKKTTTDLIAATKKTWGFVLSQKDYIPEWENFDTFIRDMGIRPSTISRLRRIDATLPYSRENCSWTSTKTDVTLAVECNVPTVVINQLRTKGMDDDAIRLYVKNEYSRKPFYMDDANRVLYHALSAYMCVPYESIRAHVRTGKTAVEIIEFYQQKEKAKLEKDKASEKHQASLPLTMVG